MTRLRSLIKEILSSPKKKDCGCGCNTCGDKAPILTEGKFKSLISEGLQHHIDKKISLFESVYRIGSDKHLSLIREARALWIRGIIEVSDDDKGLLETHLGHFGLYEGVEVPLDLPMVNEEKNKWVVYDTKTKEILPNAGKVYKKYKSAQEFVDKLKDAKVDAKIADAAFYYYNLQKKESLEERIGRILESTRQELGMSSPLPKSRAKAALKNPSNDGSKVYGLDKNGKRVELKSINDIDKFKKFEIDADLNEAMVDYDFSKEELIRVIKQLKRGASTEVGMIKAFEKALGRELTDDEIRGFKLNEAKKKKEKKDPPLNKPKRGGSKAYYVYVRDPKTKKIKKVSFGSGGLRAKIKNKEARNAFAARHNCKNKKDRTKAGYWSCNLPRYAEQLGLGSKINTFW